MNKIEDAILIYGPGRSGSTLLSNILAIHPDLGWISGYIDKYPKLPVLSVFNRVQNIHAIEKFSRSLRKWPRTSEAYNFWYFYFPSFSMPKTFKEKQQVDKLDSCVKTINLVLKYSGKKRFMTKLTGDHNLEKLNELFENLKIVYIHRDPRAVVTSYFRKKWTFHGKVGPIESTEPKELLEQYAQQYRKIVSAAQLLSGFNSIEVKYEDLIADRVSFFQNSLEFLDLDFNERFNQTLMSWKFNEHMNEKWKHDLGSDNARFVDNLLRDMCIELGYS